MSEQKKAIYDLEECQREIERGNFHHVNDTDKRKSMSYDFCMSINYHLTAAQEKILQLEAQIKSKGDL